VQAKYELRDEYLSDARQFPPTTVCYKSISSEVSDKLQKKKGNITED